VVDATLAPRHLARDTPEWQARVQVEAADLVVLNPGVPENETADADGIIAAATTARHSGRRGAGPAAHAAVARRGST